MSSRTPHRLRSLLFIPADRRRFINKAVAEPTADAVILDLEDGLPRDRVAVVRADLAQAVQALGALQHVAVRVNNDEELNKDIEAAVAAGAQAIMLPKASAVDQVLQSASLLSQAEARHARQRATGIHLLIESAIGLHHAVELASAHRRVQSLTLGVEDFSLELGIDPTAEHSDLRWAHGRILEAAAIAGIEPFGFLGSITNIDDTWSYRWDAIRSRHFGYRGSLCVHPRQVDVLNQMFLPTSSEVERARRIIEAAGSAVGATFAVDGRMVDAPVVKRARSVLDHAGHHGFQDVTSAPRVSQASHRQSNETPTDQGGLTRQPPSNNKQQGNEMSGVKAERRSRARGAMAGLAIGDAIGRPVEGMTAAGIQQQYGRITGYLAESPAGSDDTEYALLTARTLTRVGIGATSADFAHTWHKHVVSQVDAFMGAGFSEMAAIDNLRKGINPPLSGDHIHGWSDGLAMRAAPLGIAANGDLGVARRLAQSDGCVSHSGEGIAAGVVVAVAVSAGMAGATARECFDAGLSAIDEDTWTARDLKAVRALVDSGLGLNNLALAIFEEVVVDEYYWADLAPEAVSIAMASVLIGDGDFAESVLFAVNMGRDADTNAAMAGAIAGAISGIDGIPTRWLDGLRPVQGSCIKSMAGMHPLDVADQLIELSEASA